MSAVASSRFAGAGTLFRKEVLRFWRVALPMARPWIIGGLSLALMETLADFGTVAVFNVDTFTTAIYKAWFSLFSLSSAAQLASLLILVVFLLVWLEQHARGRRAYAARTAIPLRRLRLDGLRGWAYRDLGQAGPLWLQGWFA